MYDSQTVASDAKPDPLESWTIFALVVCSIAYFVGCSPAIYQRGYPPIDPIWTSIPWLWPFAVWLTAIFDDRPWTSRRRAHFWYAVVTGFIDAATPVYVVPKHFRWLSQDLLDVTVYGVVLVPLHYAGVVIAEKMSQLLRRTWRNIADGWKVGRIRTEASRPILVMFVLAAGAAFAYGYREIALDQRYRWGRTQALADWKRHDPKVPEKWEELLDGQVFVIREYDQFTGFRTRSPGATAEYLDGYRDQLSELLQQHGVPEWADKSKAVPNQVVLDMLKSNEGEVVTQFPREITRHVHLRRHDTANPHDAIRLDGQPGVSAHFSGESDVLIARHPACPQIVFVVGRDRDNSKSVTLYALSEDGKFILQAGR